MNQRHPQIDQHNKAYGKVDRRTLTTFPQPLQLRRMFPNKGTFLLCVDRNYRYKYQFLYFTEKQFLLRVSIKIWATAARLLPENDSVKSTNGPQHTAIPLSWFAARSNRLF